ncbi:unnamed protein product [Lota lota]
MNVQQPARRAANSGSILLTPQENDCLFGYLGKKCLALCSAVVQVYAADRSFCWAKRCCGVACLVKDNTQRSYFIRVLDIKDGSSMFEQELYSSFTFSSPRSYFLTFPGDSYQVGVNFASEEEARRFRSALNDLLGRRQRRAGGVCSVSSGPSLPLATVDMKNPEINSMRFHNSQHHHPHHHHHPHAPQQQAYQLNNKLAHSSHRKDKKTKSKKKRLTKADIGTPSNFQHIGHVGWDPNTGFDLNNLDPELKNLFDMCGISEAQLKDKETSKVIYEFIEKKGGVEAVKNELRRQAPPPPPTRGGPPPVPPPPPSRGGRGAPPPPPASRAPSSAPPRPPPARPGTLGAPPPPPPPTRGGHAHHNHQAPPPTPAQSPPPPTAPPLSSSTPTPPPPPPPPPPGPPPPTEPDGGGGGGGGKSALLEQIRGGAQLRKVDQTQTQTQTPAPPGVRDALLDQIRQGIQLKTVSEQQDSGPAPSAGIVGALMEVMQKRSRAIHSSDDDREEEEDEDFEDDDEWDD